jgi:hypothetical protein
MQGDLMRSEIGNGFLGLNRDIILRLVKIAKDPKKIRMVVFVFRTFTYFNVR